MIVTCAIMSLLTKQNLEKPTRDKIMTKTTLNQKIESVAKSTNQTKAQVMTKLLAKDNWTHFLLSEAK